MKTKRPIRSFAFVAVVLNLFAETACTHIRQVNVIPTAAVAESANPVPITAAVVLEPAFVNYSWSFNMMGDTFVYPLGKKLRVYAEDISRKSLRNVVVFEDAGAAVGKADVILIPRVVKVDQSVGATAFGERRFTVVIEWTMRDRANGRLLRLGTISGQGKGISGNAFTFKKHEREILQRVFDDLSLKTAKMLDEWGASPR